MLPESWAESVAPTRDLLMKLINTELGATKDLSSHSAAAEELSGMESIASSALLSSIQKQPNFCLQGLGHEYGAMRSRLRETILRPKEGANAKPRSLGLSVTGSRSRLSRTAPGQQ